MKPTKEKLSEWSASGIIGSIAFAVVMGFVSYLTGSWAVVAPFVLGHLGESVACMAVVFGLGILVGALISRQAALKRLAKKDAVIAEYEKRPTQEQMDAAIAEMDDRIAELEREADIDELEQRFKRMSFKAKSAAVGAVQDNGTDVIDNEEVGMNRAAPFWSEAEKNEFLIMEPSGADRSRAVPTSNLKRLIESRPMIEKQVSADFFNDNFRQHPHVQKFPDGTTITTVYETDAEHVIDKK